MKYLIKQSIKLDLPNHEGIPYGEVNGYFYNLAQINQGMIPVIYYVFATNGILGELKRVYAKFMNIHSNTIGNANILYVPIGGNLSIKVLEKRKEKLVELTNTLKKLEINSYTVCPYTGLDTNLTKRLVKSALINITEEGYSKYIAANKMIVSDESKLNKNIPMSILFAVIGAVIGAIPSLLVMLLLEYIFAPLFAIIPICSFIGYKLGNGPKTSYSLVITSFISVIVAMGSMVLYYYINLNSNYLTFADLFNNDEARSGFIRDMSLTAAFAAIGILISWQYLKNQTISKHKKEIK